MQQVKKNAHAFPTCERSPTSVFPELPVSLLHPVEVQREPEQEGACGVSFTLRQEDRRKEFPVSHYCKDFTLAKIRKK